MAQGKLIREAHGKLAGVRILDASGRTEVTVQEEGMILGVEDLTTATFTGAPRPDGRLFGEVNRVIVTKEGDSILSFGSGLATPKGRPPALSVRGPLYYQTSSNKEKLMPLNGMMSVYEVEIDEQGKFTVKEWEWK